MTQKSNDYQIKHLVEYLNKTLVLENAAIDRLPTRIKETPIQEFKQRMVQHLEHTNKQKNGLEQMILEFRERSDYISLNLLQTTAESKTNSTRENTLQTFAISSDKKDNFIDGIHSIPEGTEFTKIKQDYTIAYEELVAYETLLHIAKITEFYNKDVVIKLLNESKQEKESMVYWYQVHAPIVLDNLWPKMINNSMKRSQAFLMNHRNSKIPLFILYADLVGSTRMSMTLPIQDLVLMIRAFTQELSNVIERHGGYVLKYSGDAVISFFPYANNDDKYDICMKSIQCAKSIINAIKKEINSILGEKYGYPELQVKIGIDIGENAIIQYGYEKNSPIDILGYGMNIVSKITSLTASNSVSLGETMYNLLDKNTQSDFQILPLSTANWKYVNLDTKNPYKVYRYSSDSHVL